MCWNSLVRGAWGLTIGLEHTNVLAHGWLTHGSWFMVKGWRLMAVKQGFGREFESAAIGS